MCGFAESVSVYPSLMQVSYTMERVTVRGSALMKASSQYRNNRRASDNPTHRARN
jgi:hypothetical protein